MKKILLLLSLVCIRQVNAQTWVTIPDAHFVTFLQGLIPSAMHGDSLNTSSTLVTTTTHSMNANATGISNLNGIQYFTSLTHLSCNNNSIASFPALPNSLIYFDCSVGSVTSLPVLPNSLSYLLCQSNLIANLPALSNALVYLDCSSNLLTSLPTLPSTLTYLNCNGNYNINNLPALPNSLISLNCEGNSLATLPTLGNALVYLNCSAKQQASPFTLPTLPNSLDTLYCSGDFMTNLPALPPSLTWLDCDNNNLTGLPALPNSLKFLSCDYNEITCFPHFPNSITTLYIDSYNSFNCLPNYISAMGADTVTYPLCGIGNTNGCAVTGIEQLSFFNFYVTVYPNPTTEQFIIETNVLDKLNIYLYDVNGRQVFSKIVSNKSNIDVTNLDEGVYTLTIKTVDRVTNKKLIIVR